MTYTAKQPDGGDGELESILDELATTIHNLVPGDVGSMDRVLRPITKAKQKLLARDQRMELEAKLSQADDDWWAITHATVPEVKILLRERMKELTAQLSQLTQYNQSEREE